MKLKRFESNFDENWDNIEENEEKHLDIKIKHIIEYLQQYDPETKVILDKDDWLSDENDMDENDMDEIDIIDRRGIFYYMDYDGGLLIIQN